MEATNQIDRFQKKLTPMTGTWRILLVDDSEDDYHLTRAMLSEARGAQFILEWVSTYEKALEVVECDSLDAILVDYDLGKPNGIELVRELIARGCRIPIILLTGHGNYELDVEAMKVGAADYLGKNEITSPFLERAIRYAIERKQTEEALRQANERLEASNTLLAGAKDELEARVMERTREIQQANTRFRTIFEESDLGIKLLDLEGRILASNPAFQEMVGYRENELHQMRFTDLTDQADNAISLNLFRQMASGQIDRFRLEKRYRRKGGELLWVRQNVSLVRDEYRTPSFAIAMIENITERKQIESELAEVQRRLMDSREEERIHLSQELHDGPLQSLHGLTYQLKSIQEDLLAGWTQVLALVEAPTALPFPLDKIMAQLEQLQEATGYTIQELRGICTELRPPALAPFGLEKAIRSHTDSFQQEYPAIAIHLDLVPDGQILPERIRLALFRIFQHALVNAARHGQARNIRVNLNLNEHEIDLKIQDDGRGFIVPQRWIDFVRQGHLGLAGASERAQAIGGILKVDSQPGQGTVLHVTVPRQTAESISDR